MKNYLQPSLLITMLTLSVCVVASLAPQSAAAATESPEAPTRIIVGYAPGGAADNLARIYAEQLRVAGQGTVLVENKPGASARLALDFVKRSKPDGKTIFIGPSPLFTIFPLTYKKLTYDADKDLIPAALLTEVPTVISAGVQQPYKNMKEYVEWAKRNPTSASIGLATSGSSGHLGAVALGKSIGVPLTPVVYRGASPMLIDVISGNLSIGWDAVASKINLYKGGKLQFLGVSGQKRAKALPEVPTLKEQGFNQFEFATSWYGAFLPAGTPAEVVSKVEQLFLSASSDASASAKLEALGLEVIGRPGKEMQRRIQTERSHWKPIVEASGFTAED